MEESLSPSEKIAQELAQLLGEMETNKASGYALTQQQLEQSRLLAEGLADMVDDVDMEKYDSLFERRRQLMPRAAEWAPRTFGGMNPRGQRYMEGNKTLYYKR